MKLFKPFFADLARAALRAGALSLLLTGALPAGAVQPAARSAAAAASASLHPVAPAAVRSSLVRVADGRMLAPDIARIVNRGELLVAMLGVDTPPFFYVKDGKLTGLDGALYRVYAKATDTFQLANLANNGAISTAAFTAFTSGTAQKVAVAVPELILEAIILLVGHWTNFQSRIEGGNFITRVPVAVEQMLDTEKVWAVV